MLLTWLAALLALVVWGAHATAPFGLARGDGKSPSRWRVAALPLALVTLTAGLAALRGDLDGALAAGFGPGFPASWAVRTALLLLFVAVLSDVALFVAGGNLGGGERRALASCGALGAAGSALAAELLLDGDAATWWPILLLAAGCRLAVSLAAGEVLAPWRPRLGLLGTGGLLLYPLLLPPKLNALLSLSGDRMTLGASALLFAAARWLPARLRRPALVAAALLAALFFARAAALSSALAARLPVTISAPD